MPDYAHFHLEDGLPFYITGVGPRPIRGTKMYNSFFTYRWGKQPLPQLCECETTQLADELLEKHPNAQRASRTDLQQAFTKLEAPWALVGPLKLSMLIPSVWSTGPALSDMKAWVKGNCEGDVCILTGSSYRRISFATEDDYVLGHLTFHGSFAR